MKDNQELIERAELRRLMAKHPDVVEDFLTVSQKNLNRAKAASAGREFPVTVSRENS